MSKNLQQNNSEKVKNELDKEKQTTIDDLIFNIVTS